MLKKSLLLVCIIYVSCYGQDKCELNISDKIITIEIPNGFTSLKPSWEYLLEEFKKNTPSSNVFLTALISKEDSMLIDKGESNGLSNYILIQTFKESINTDMPINIFKDICKNTIDNLPKSRNDVDNNLKLNNVGISVDEYKYFGTFQNAELYMSAAAIMSIKRGDVIFNKQAFTTNVLLAKNKLLFVYIYSRYKDEDSVKYVKHISETLVPKIVNDNPSIYIDSKNNLFDFILDNMNWDKVIGKAIFGGIIGGVAILIVLWRQGIRRKARYIDEGKECREKETN